MAVVRPNSPTDEQSDGVDNDQPDSLFEPTSGATASLTNACTDGIPDAGTYINADVIADACADVIADICAVMRTAEASYADRACLTAPD